MANSLLAEWTIILSLGYILSTGSSKSVPLIIDTDIGSGGCKDVDDVAALCIANAMADNGEADLLAVLTNSLNPKGVDVVSIINRHYGRQHVPIGAYPGGILGDNTSLPFVQHLIEEFAPQRITPVFRKKIPTGAQVYRRILSQQIDHSVVISSIGFLTNIEALMRSSPDRHSNLDGTALLAKKVKLIGIVGGHYPPGGLAYDAVGLCTCNFCGVRPNATGRFGNRYVTPDAEAAAKASSFVVNNLPKEVQVIYLGVTQGHAMGNRFLDVAMQGGLINADCPQAQTDNPCRQALSFASSNRTGLGNSTGYNWDPLLTLLSVRGITGADARTCATCTGENTVDATGMDHWVSMAPNATNQSYVLKSYVLKATKKRHPFGKALDSINQLLCQKPVLNG